MTRADWKIEGMHCEGCAQTITALVSGQSGVASVSVSHEEGRARIEFDPARIDPAVLEKLIRRAGFRVQSA